MTTQHIDYVNLTNSWILHSQAKSLPDSFLSKERAHSLCLHSSPQMSQATAQWSFLSFFATLSYKLISFMPACQVHN